MNDLVPIYHQVKEVIKRRITDGFYGPGGKIPSESKLIEEFGVSRLTIRQALGLLVQENILVSKRGKGSFVTDNPKLLKGLSRRLYGSIEDLFYYREKLKTRHARISRFSVSPVIRKRLNLNPKEKTVVEAVRVRYAEGQATVVTKTYLPVKYGQLLTEKKLTQSPLILEILEMEAGISFKRFQQSLEATFADKEIAGLLKVPAGSPILLVERLMLAARYKPVLLALSWFRADIFKYLESYRIAKINDRIRLISEGFNAKGQDIFW